MWTATGSRTAGTLQNSAGSFSAQTPGTRRGWPSDAQTRTWAREASSAGHRRD